MTTEDRIREDYKKEIWSDTVWEGCGPTALDIYRAGYMALLNSLERMGSQQVVYVKTGRSKNAALYMLPNGVEKP